MRKSFNMLLISITTVTNLMASDSIILSNSSHQSVYFRCPENVKMTRKLKDLDMKRQIAYMEGDQQKAEQLNLAISALKDSIEQYRQDSRR